jgi:hypothetical protein
MSASTTVESIRTARAAKRVSRCALPITARVNSATTSGPSRRASLRDRGLVRHLLGQRQQAEPTQVQRVRHLPH